MFDILTERKSVKITELKIFLNNEIFNTLYSKSSGIELEIDYF